MPTSFELSQLILISAAYLLLLFGVAWTSEKGLIPRWVIRHPLTYTLSLGVYASAWAFYGTVGRVREVGGFVLHVVHGAIHFLHQLQLPLVEDAGEVSAHRIAHVLLALLLFIGFEAANQLVAVLFCFGGHGTASHSL